MIKLHHEYIPYVATCVSVEENFPGKISIRSSFSVVNHIAQKLSLDSYECFRSEMPFGHFFWVNKDFITCGQIIHYLILRQVDSPKKNEMWFSIGGTPARFGKKEFALITGLNCGLRPNDETMEKHTQSTKLKKMIFKNVPANKKITLKYIETHLAFDDWDTNDDQFRLALVYFVEGILMA
ncbi:hypothetical protein UlMin_000566 [Ulmus minor]